MQAVCDQHVGGLGGAVHGGGLQRRDPGVGPGRGVRSGGQELRAEIGQVPAPGEVQGPIQMGAGIDEHVDQLGRWRPPFRLCHQLEHRVVADLQVRYRRIGVESRSQPIDVADQERMQSRLDPLIVTIAHQRPFCTAAARLGAADAVVSAAEGVAHSSTHGSHRSVARLTGSIRQRRASHGVQPVAVHD